MYSDCRQMRTTCDEGDVIASLRESGSKIATDTSRTKDGDFHTCLLTTMGVEVRQL
jgi:hypothetical protein